MFTMQLCHALTLLFNFFSVPLDAFFFINIYCYDKKEMRVIGILIPLIK